MTRRAAVLASGLGALAIGAAGCGGGGGATAVGTGGDMTTTTTATSQGGVLGAQANVDEQKLRTQADRIQTMLDRQIEQLRGASSTQDLAATAKSIRTQLLKSADRLDRLDLQSSAAQQQRGHLESALRSLAADVTTLQGDAQSGNLQKALNDVTNLSSLVAVRQSIDAIQSGSATGQDTLRSQATSIVGTLQLRLLELAGANDAQTFAQRVGRLQQFLQRHDRRVSELNVPESLQDEQQALLGFLHDWEDTLDAARDEAVHGNLDEAKQQLKHGSLSDVEGLVQSLTASS